MYADDEAKFKALCKAAQAAVDAMTPEERKAHWREQAIDFTYGNLKCSTNHGHNLTREDVARIYDAMHADDE